MEEGIAALQAKYEECVAKKEELKDKCDLCSARLTRAEKVSYVIGLILIPGFSMYTKMHCLKKRLLKSEVASTL